MLFFFCFVLIKPTNILCSAILPDSLSFCFRLFFFCHRCSTFLLHVTIYYYYYVDDDVEYKLFNILYFLSLCKIRGPSIDHIFRHNQQSKNRVFTFFPLFCAVHFTGQFNALFSIESAVNLEICLCYWINEIEAFDHYLKKRKKI